MTEPTQDRSPIEMAALAAWLNVRVDQIPPENRAHLNPHTMAAWKRVGKAAIIAYFTHLGTTEAEIVEALEMQREFLKVEWIDPGAG